MLQYTSIAVIAGMTAAVCAGCGSGSATATTGRETTKTQAESTDPPAAAGERPKLRPGAKTRVLAAAGDQSYDKTFDDLRFETKIEEPFRRELLTEPIEKMFGERIRIRGYILPTAQKTGLREFVLVRDNQECCFGPGAAIYDCILVEMKSGHTAEYTPWPVAVEGTFGFKEIIGPDKRHLAIYHVEGEAVR